ncbi:hypothetical protein [Methanobacterium alcaliphilum]|uniref:hypothetical protein n=1 Tax=Methanobacterium alcaliphilum TaxID=392018 RepID=UPI00200B1A44|nr:hypothetical protein [Methanobacterium alcaliphilum]MCK9152137.1 hypothetical protein [Methanobacterium alcaliphilum]
MNLVRKILANTRKPKESTSGRIMLKMMNIMHDKNAMWGLNHIEIKNSANILEIGCGGGKNISNLLKKSPEF